jgi:hypothetical protein
VVSAIASTRTGRARFRQRVAVFADAAALDEAGLRQTLAIYRTPLRDKASASGGAAAAPATIAAGNESALSDVHLAHDAASAAAATTSATTNR